MLREIVENTGLIIASIVAVKGINAWQREFRGKKEYELAEEVLALAYDCRQRIREIRSPGGYTSEGSTRKRLQNETKEQSTLLDRAFVVIERYQKQKDAFLRLFSIRYRFAAHFGVDAAAPIDDLEGVISELYAAAEILPALWEERRDTAGTLSEEERMRFLTILHENEAVIQRRGTRYDVIGPKVDEIVRTLEETCSAVLLPQKGLIRTGMDFVADWFRAQVEKK